MFYLRLAIFDILEYEDTEVKRFRNRSKFYMLCKVVLFRKEEPGKEGILVITG